MTMTRTELQNAMSLGEVAKRLEQAGEINLSCDFDAIPFGEEKYRTAHFGWISDQSKEMVSIWTDNRTDTWTVKLTGSEPLYGSEFKFENFQLTNFSHVGARERPIKELKDAVPEVFLQLVAAVKERGLASVDFQFDHDEAPRPGL